MKKTLIFGVIIILSIFSVVSVYAEESLATTTTTTVEASTTIQTTTTTTVSATPTFPFGLWWSRIKLIFLRDPLKKSEVVLDILNQRLNSLQQSANNSESLKKALENYNKAIEDLKNRLSALKETSNNPNIDRLLDKLTQNQVRHQEIFDYLINRASTSTLPLLQQVRERWGQEIVPLRLRFENQEEFMNRIQEALNNLTATTTPSVIGEFRQLRIMQTLRTQLQNMEMNNFVTSTQEKLIQIQNRLEERIQNREQVLQKQGFSSSAIERILNNLPVPTSTPQFRNLPTEPPPGSKKMGD